jgi:hypothetical protein
MLSFWPWHRWRWFRRRIVTRERAMFTIYSYYSALIHLWPGPGLLTLLSWNWHIRRLHKKKIAHRPNTGVSAEAFFYGGRNMRLMCVCAGFGLNQALILQTQIQTSWWEVTDCASAIVRSWWRGWEVVESIAELIVNLKQVQTNTVTLQYNTRWRMRLY